MKKTSSPRRTGLLAPLAAATLLITGPAAAQSSVTLFGVIDLAARSVRNSGSDAAQSLVSGSNATSRFGLRGSEDLGDGLSAGFHLEHGLAADTGSAAGGSQFWDRRATVSLGHKRWGELRAGRDFVPTYTNWTRYDPFSYVGVAGANNLISGSPQGPIRAAFGRTGTTNNPNTTVRASNALQWLLPAGWAGLEGGLMLAAGEGGDPANGQAKVVAARLGWSSGALAVSAATARSDTTLTTAGGQFKDHALGASWSPGPLKLSAVWRQFKQGSAKQTNLMLSLSVPLGLHEIKASVIRADLDGRVGNTRIDANDATQLGLGYGYNLSKRSAVFASVARIHNQGAASFNVPGGAAAPTAGGSSTGWELGLRHNF